ncbi:dynactin [Lineolata rhizophorae]|uniref:Dynactin subunit 5 n=1 Tax=Lineolata rhizophorae TaxID=578093 RepID=A0A6A6NN86_9PEZI|nr:dynactin [Lineolata rhizophorae]
MSRQSAGGRKAQKGEYIETDTGNKVSRRANITGTANITLGGKTVIQADAYLRGDLQRRTDGADAKAPATAINVGRYTFISQGCVIKPPSRISRGQVSYYPLRIGDNVFIGPGSTVSAASIGSHVHIGENSILQAGVIVKDCVKILPGSIVPANMVVPSFSVVGGQPARVVGELGEGWGVSPGGMSGGATTTSSGEWVEGGELRELIRMTR